MTRKWTAAGLGVGLAVLGLTVVAPSTGQAAVPVVVKAAKGQLKRPTLPVKNAAGQVIGRKPVAFISNGTLAAASAGLQAKAAGAEVEGATDRLFAADGNIESATKGDAVIKPGTLGCRKTYPNGNVRVNQDCTFRRQAEEDIIFNPADPSNLLAGQNDSRVGFNQCGIDYSTDAGRHWGDLLPPFRQKLNDPESQLPTAADPNSHTILGSPGTFHTYDAGSDPTVAFDTEGRGFFSCITFDLASNASMLYVTTSPANANGSYFYNLASSDRRFVVAEDNDGRVFHDKNFITVDTGAKSPNKDNVYVTWTVFRFDESCAGGSPGVDAFCESPIYGSMSTDHGFTWSTPEEVSGSNAGVCFQGDVLDPAQKASACNQDQGSDPVVLPNGDLAVAWNNFNTPVTDPNPQQLSVRCRPSGDSAAGTAHLNCGRPARIGADVEAGFPLCDFGRGPEQCIPGPWIRTNDFPRLQVNTRTGQLYATWQDVRNGTVDIQLATSTDGGRTWSTTVTVNPDRGLDHYMPAVDVDETTGRVAVSYYRSKRVPNERTVPTDGFTPGRDPGVAEQPSDYVLAGGQGVQAPFAFVKVSPSFPPPDGAQAGFNGDYSGITVTPDGRAHPIWSDTRNANPDPVNGVGVDEDVFTTSRAIPSGAAAVAAVTTLG